MYFCDFFKLATGTSPYPYQERFATSIELPHLLRVPTGAGKTATAVLGWLWRRMHGGQPTPGRLVYCLPMRVLVEQSYRESRQWLENLGLSENVGLHLLMGGAESKEWHLRPEQPAILIGTQDMLLSRALNRGYAASRFHWPIDFGLLNNDCLWVFDEPQLMAGGVSTSAQLAGLRESLDTIGTCSTVWMSATLEPSWLDTVDFRGKFTAPPFELDSKRDYAPELPLHRRMTAEKTLGQLDAVSSKDMKAVAKAALAKHEPGTQTLVILNTVDRAKATYDELGKLLKKSDIPKLLLVHSRYRPAERMKLNESLTSKDESADRIIVATQVVEAGVDISAKTLISELSPWSSMVQRIGRCNRTGLDGAGRVYWINLDEKVAAPYDEDELTMARSCLKKLDGANVSPQALDEFKTREDIRLPFEHKHVLRRRDLLDLFDTAPDLSGNDIDISRFVRSDDPDTDVLVYWRNWSGDVPSSDMPGPQRDELCRVPVQKFSAFVQSLDGKRRRQAYVWDHLDDLWKVLDNKLIRPGMTVLLPCEAGGYSELGWDEASTTVVSVVPRPDAESSPSPEEGLDSDPNSNLSIPQPLTVEQHTQNVCNELELLLDKKFDLPIQEHVAELRTAARWHDLGKAHDAFQQGMRRSNPDLTVNELWAKSGKHGKLTYSRPFFRHELASALAILTDHSDWPFEVAYLVAAHHGRVRVSIRSVPGEDLSEGDASARFALGNRDGDQLPEVPLGDGVTSSQTTLDLTPTEMGGDASWTGKALQLLQDLGPFRLAYLEAILRAADVRASKKEAGQDV
ncbi:MAG: CRISPR-associated helicase Cas3' [Planctomycetaceae bacterium]